MFHLRACYDLQELILNSLIGLKEFQQVLENSFRELVAIFPDIECPEKLYLHSELYHLIMKSLGSQQVNGCI